MELFIIRHGEASGSALDERGPELSPEGRESIKRLSIFLKQYSLKPQKVFSSELRRAQQTAELLNQVWNLPYESVSWLRPGQEVSTLFQELSEIKSQRVALIGHLPTLGWLVSALVWGLPPKEIILPKGSLTILEVVDFSPGLAKLRGLIDSKMMRNT